MKFETPKIVINAFSENIVTAASEIATSDTVVAAKNKLETIEKNNVKVSNILTFTLD